MNTTKNRLIQKLLLSRKANSKKKNGFTLIELMVVVAIVGILSAVGLPELTKAQKKGKDTAAIATLTNAAKECSINLIIDEDTAEDLFTAETAAGDSTASPPTQDGKFFGVSGTCAIANDGDVDDFTLTSESTDETVFTVTFDGAVPNPAA